MIVDCHSHIWTSKSQLGEAQDFLCLAGPDVDDASAESHYASAGPADFTFVLGFISNLLNAEISNDEIKSYVASHPDRLIGFAGTDPTEGAALGIAIVERLVGAGTTLIATTHHSELKLYAHRTDAVMNASVEFDMETLSPTYRLTIGLPGQSNALAIAARLGMPPGVVDAARAGLTTDEREMEALLRELRTQLAAAEERAARAAEARDEAHTLRAGLEQQLDELASASARLREEAHARIRDEVREVERLLERARREVEAARLDQAAADLQRARTAAAEVAPRPKPVPASPPAQASPVIEPGRAVWLRGVSLPGEVLTEPNDVGEFDVQLGALRTRVRVQQVLRSEAWEHGASVVSSPPPPPPVPFEVELRGQTLDEALPAVEQFLDQAARSGHGRVRVIHGRGTGTLRRAVRELLERHPLVTSFEPADSREGGEGVTVAFLAGTREGG